MKGEGGGRRGGGRGSVSQSHAPLLRQNRATLPRMHLPMAAFSALGMVTMGGASGSLFLALGEDVGETAGASSSAQCQQHQLCESEDERTQGASEPASHGDANQTKRTCVERLHCLEQPCVLFWLRMESNHSIRERAQHLQQPALAIVGKHRILGFRKKATR